MLKLVMFTLLQAKQSMYEKINCYEIHFHEKHVTLFFTLLHNILAKYKRKL